MDFLMKLGFYYFYYLKYTHVTVIQYLLSKKHHLEIYFICYVHVYFDACYLNRLFEMHLHYLLVSRISYCQIEFLSHISLGVFSLHYVI